MYERKYIERDTSIEYLLDANDYFYKVGEDYENICQFSTSGLKSDVGNIYPVDGDYDTWLSSTTANYHSASFSQGGIDFRAELEIASVLENPPPDDPFKVSCSV